MKTYETPLYQLWSINMTDIATLAYVDALKTYTTKTSERITTLTGLSLQLIVFMLAQSQRGVDQHANPVISDKFVKRIVVLVCWSCC
jgi:hypothetical protein